jgi:thioredoxin reductase (NADPH)
MDRVDVVVLGGGPAGLTAGIYAGRAGLNTLLLEQMMPGGQAASTEWIENYPGFDQGISGFDLTAKMEAQARRFGLNIRSETVESVRLDLNPKVVTFAGGAVQAKAVIVATGSNPKRLNVPGEAELKGRGVSYCATCDGPFFKDKAVVTVGGGSSGVQESLYLTRFASSIQLVEYMDRLNAENILRQRASANPKISFLLGHEVLSIDGSQRVEAVTVRDRATGERKRLAADGVFIWIGFNPSTGFLEGSLELDGAGYIVTDSEMAASVPGVFAAGDVRSKSVRQVTTACGDATIAVESALRFIESR